MCKHSSRAIVSPVALMSLARQRTDKPLQEWSGNCLLPFGLQRDATWDSFQQLSCLLQDKQAVGHSNFCMARSFRSWVLHTSLALLPLPQFLITYLTPQQPAPQLFPHSGSPVHNIQLTSLSTSSIWHEVVLKQREPTHVLPRSWQGLRKLPGWHSPPTCTPSTCEPLRRLS